MAGGSFSANDRGFRRGFTLVEILVVVAILATLMVLLVPAVQGARESARRTSCINNQRQLTLAVISFGETNGFVPGWRNELRISGTFVHPGWPVMILPFADQNTLYGRIVSGAVTAYRTLATSGTGVFLMPYVCPSRPRENADPRTILSYAGNCGSGSNTNRYDGVMLDTADTAVVSGIRRGRVSLADISAADGTGNTVFLSEKSVTRNDLIFPQGVWTGTSTTGTSCTFDIPQTNGTYVPGFGIVNAGSLPPPLNALTLGGPSAVGLVNAPSSNHPTGVVMSFGDGHAQFVAETLQPMVYAQLLSWDRNLASGISSSTWNAAAYPVVQETDY